MEFIHEIDAVVLDFGGILKAEPKDTEEPIMTRIVDSAVHLLGSKQDIAHTVHRVFEDREEWDLVVLDGHGKMNNKNPHTNKSERYNVILLIINDLISTGQLDTILERDIYGEESPALYLQRLFSKKCIEYKQSMLHVGATMSLVQIRHNFTTKKITVHVETVGDSPVTIHCNGVKVLSSVIHTHTNLDELKRLKDEKRINMVATRPTISFKVLDENTLCAKDAKYICVGECDLAMTQSLGHIEYKSWSRQVGDETGVFGLAPYKATMVFEETDELNIKGYSDGVSDIIGDTIIYDNEFLTKSNAMETADFAKVRWEKMWRNVPEAVYLKTLEETGSTDTLKSAQHTFGDGMDDVSCVSWIQSRK